MTVTRKRPNLDELARLADDGCPHVADVDEVPERQHVAFVELLQHAGSVAQRHSYTRLPKQPDSGPIRLW
ncbi:hypothetical protein [Gemmata sp.]|uniref:hypothetical protein n=1 Tax=Gemmata sp. TaxID=1914242 RepID=UPI003F71F6D9